MPMEVFEKVPNYLRDQMKVSVDRDDKELFKNDSDHKRLLKVKMDADKEYRDYKYYKRHIKK